MTAAIARSPDAIRRREVGGHRGLALGVLAAVGMAAVDHDDGAAGRSAAAARRPAARLAPNNWGRAIRPEARDGCPRCPVVCMQAGAPSRVERREPVGMAGRADGVDRHLDVAVGPVLESDRHREARGQLAMDLALDGAGADRAPAHEVRVVLAERRVEELGRNRAGPAAVMSAMSLLASRRPLSMWKVPSRSGSLIRPFQPTTVLGFSK